MRMLALSASIALASCAHEAAAPPRRAPAPLGSVDFRVSCDVAVQADFNRAVALLHHMTYTQAAERFRAIAERDPRCAMAHWGIAMTLFQPLWPTRPSRADLAKGWHAVETARALAPGSARDR